MQELQLFISVVSFGFIETRQQRGTAWTGSSGKASWESLLTGNTASEREAVSVEPLCRGKCKFKEVGLPFHSQGIKFN